jgi:hypothetical protein
VGWLIISTGNVETVSVTKIDCGLLEAPAELIVTFPEYAPAPSPPGFTEMLRFAGVVPLFGVTNSQLPPEVVVTEALKAKAAPLLPTDTLCPPGVAPPSW